MVFLPGSVYVTQTTERRDTGTQYTPKDLADEIVRYALEPLVYEPGPAQGADPADWRIKPARGRSSISGSATRRSVRARSSSPPAATSRSA